MILLFLTTVLLVPSWQVVPTTATPTTIVAADRADEDNVDVTSTLVVSEDDLRKREMLSRLLVLYQQQVSLGEENYKLLVDTKRGGARVTNAQVREAERKLVHAKITLSAFIIDNMAENPTQLSQERKQLLSCYQRLFDLAQGDYRQAEAYAKEGAISHEEILMSRQKMLDAEILVASFQFQEEQRKAMFLADAAGSGLHVSPPVAKSTKFTPAEQERLKALYQQIIEQEDENRKMIEAYFNLGDPRGNYVAFMEATGGVIKAKITLSTFLLNETDLTPQEYANERQNLRSLYEELRDVAKHAVKAAQEAYQSPPQQRIQYAEVARYERKLTEVEIALIRLFPENEGNRGATPWRSQSEPQS